MYYYRLGTTTKIKTNFRVTKIKLDFFSQTKTLAETVIDGWCAAQATAHAER